MEKKNYQSKTWCFTSYEPYIKPNDQTAYMCWQLEICPTSGKTHMQGYLETKTKRTLSGLKKLFGNNVHWEVRKGSQEQAIKYCKNLDKIHKINDKFKHLITDKHYKFKEFGKKSSQGERIDIRDYKDIIMKKDITKEEIMEEYPEMYAKYKNLTLDYIGLREKKKDKPLPFVWTLFGEPGKGKSKIAHIIGEYCDSCYTLTGNYKWWEGYNNEICIIMDDYEGQLSTKDLCQLLDRYKCKREIKNGTVYINSPLIFITTNTLEWTEKPEIDRRIDLITKVHSHNPTKKALRIGF